MKKILITTMLLLSLLLSACGANKDVTNKADTDPTGQSVVSEETAVVSADDSMAVFENPEENPESYLEKIDEIKSSDEFNGILDFAGTVETDEDRTELKSKLDSAMSNLGDVIEEYSYDGSEESSILIVFKGGYHYIISVGVPQEGLLGSGSSVSGNKELSSKSGQDIELVENKKMLIISQFDEKEKNSVYVDGYKAIKKMYESNTNGGECDIIYNADVSDYKNLDDYGIVIFASHGGLIEEENSYRSAISTGEKTSLRSSIKNFGDLLNGTLYTMAPTSEERAAGIKDEHYGIGEDFIRKYYPPGSLDNTVVLAGCCYGYHNDSLANAFYDAGAGAYIGFSYTTYASYANFVFNNFFSMWLNGDSLEEALEKIIAEYPNDVDAYKKVGNKLNKDIEQAGWLKYGGPATGIKLTTKKILTVTGTVIDNVAKYSDEYHRLWKEYNDKGQELAIDSFGIEFDESIDDVSEAEIGWSSGLDPDGKDLVGKHLTLKGELNANEYNEDVTFNEYEGCYLYHPNGRNSFMITEIVN